MVQPVFPTVVQTVTIIRWSLSSTSWMNRSPGGVSLVTLKNTVVTGVSDFYNAAGVVESILCVFMKAPAQYPYRITSILVDSAPFDLCLMPMLPFILQSGK